MDEPQESAAAMFERTLHMSRALAGILASAGIYTLEELAYVPADELLEIEGLEASQIAMLRQQARTHLLNEALKVEKHLNASADRLLDDDDEGDGDPQSSVHINPVKPMSGGGSAPIDDTKKA